MANSKYEIRITRRARKDIEKLSPKLRIKLFDIIKNVISESPYEGKKLLGELAGSYSYRLTYQDRIVYSIAESHKMIIIERAKTHFGD